MKNTLTVDFRGHYEKKKHLRDSYPHNILIINIFMIFIFLTDCIW